ncbi:MAG: hypothetical protein KDA24_20750 [Deltaproteobacteria bacterium]|nr:hypothetical protein [Deltaproteobacteria bacterium]
MRLIPGLVALLGMVLLLACNPQYPPPEELPAEYTACDGPEDCTVVELGCCDACNGGTARSVASDQADAVTDRYSEQCQPGYGCNLMGCAAWLTTCDEGVCGLERGDLL